LRILLGLLLAFNFAPSLLVFQDAVADEETYSVLSFQLLDLLAACFILALLAQLLITFSVV